MILKRYCLPVYILLITSNVLAQSDDGLFKANDLLERPAVKKVINIPDVKGYKVLKADFHVHTIFSDGEVLPGIRMQEAMFDGLDAISLTEHVEGKRYKEYVKADFHLRSYELVKDMAEQSGLLLIKGVEITRNTPPGHFNAIFIGDPADYITSTDTALNKEAIMKAARQHAFIFWNHPGWQVGSNPSSYTWTSFVDELQKEKVLGGIEVVNNFEIHTKALDWAIEKGLTVIGNSDVHALTSFEYNLSPDYNHRTMTLVLAREKTASSLREALDAGRTIAWVSKYLAGREENVRDLFNACVKMSKPFLSKGQNNYYELTNNSDLFFEMVLRSGEGTRKIVLPPSSSQVIVAPKGQSSLTYEVVNAFVGGNRFLKVEIPLSK